MSYINWDASFETGVPDIDNQHKKLVNILNKLWDIHNAGGTNESLSPILSELIMYTKIHFNNEERHMEVAEYPAIDEHRGLHRDLIAQVADFEEKLKTGTVNIDNKLVDFLKNWLTVHILKEDKKYVPYMKK